MHRTPRRAAALAALALAALAPLPAAAVLVTVDPASFADGTVVGEATAGVTLSVEGAAGPSAVRVRELGGRSYFAHDDLSLLDQTGTYWFDGGPLLRADFAAATDYVRVDFRRKDNVDFARLEIYDVNGVLLDAKTLDPIPGFLPVPIEFSRATRDIAFIRALSNSDAGEQDAVRLTLLAFDAATVPEPTSALLLGGGLGLLGIARRPRARVGSGRTTPSV